MDEGLRVVDFPSVLEGELKIFGFTSLELLVIGLISGFVWLLLADYGEFAIAASLLTFALLVLLKAMMPEETGYAFPAYAAYFLVKRKTVYAHEVDTTKYIPSLKFVDDWICKLPDGLASVIEVKPVNFFYALPAEQRAYLDSYKDMLNSLDFPIQILSIACEFDITSYMNHLVLRYRDEDIAANPMLRNVLDDYIRWLNRVVGETIQRRYFIVVTVQSEDVSELKRRVETVIAGLRRGGIQAEILNRDGILAIYDLINYRRIMPANYDSTKLLLKEVGQ